MTRLLLVEDDTTLQLALTLTLADAGFDVTVAVSVGAARVSLAGTRPDVVVLDLGLPDEDGSALLADLRREDDVPVLVLTAQHDRDVKLALLRDGADDFVTKPFDSDEVVERLRAIIRRSSGRRRPRRIEAAGLVIDLDAGVVERADGPVLLTPTERRLLDALVSADGRLLGHEELLRTVWGESYGTESEYLRTFVAQLRRKLGDDASRPALIRTHPGIGYRWIGD